MGVPASITNRVSAKPSESSLFFVLWSQNRYLWGIGDMPRDHSALGGELSATLTSGHRAAIVRAPAPLTYHGLSISPLQKALSTCRYRGTKL
jgi:hypothetical protein